MPDWNELLNELSRLNAQATQRHDLVRRRYLAGLHNFTKRNVIIYYSAWLQKIGASAIASIDDGDKVGFMTTIHGLDRDKGLDLILHTPGGEMAATESIVDYLRSMFDDIRAVVPQLAMSGGTMIACACRSILMGKQSSLGPIDPQLNGMAAHGIIEEFKKAYEEMTKNPVGIPLWQPIIAKYEPTLIGECEKAIKWSQEMVKEWLVSGMLKGQENKEAKADKIIDELGDHALTKSHSRHLSASRCEEIGLDIEYMEEDQALQDAILSVHHACMHTLSATSTVKLIENHDGKAYVIHGTQVRTPLPPQ